MRQAFIVSALLLLLCLSLAVQSYHIHKKVNDDDRAESSSCAVGARPTVMEALNELFTCLLETRIEGTDPYKRAFTIDFGGMAGSGLTQPPLLPGIFSAQSLRQDASESFRKFFDVLPAFTVELGQNETRGPTELALIDTYERHLESSAFFVDTFATLKANGELGGVATVGDFIRGVVRDQWFKLYGRSSKSHAAGLRESSGFGHVMVGEIRGQSVTGFHSWLQILSGEESSEFQYKGHFKVSRNPVPAASLQFSWRGKLKSISSFWFGTPPDFELAVMSASFIVNPGRKTRFTVKGKEVAVQTFVVNHQPESVGSAYPTL